MTNQYNSLEQAKKLAATPEGQQLAALLQQLGGENLQTLFNQAAAGDLSKAKQAVALLLKDPKARQLLETLGGMNGN